MGRRDVYTDKTGTHNVLRSFYILPFHFELRANLHPTTRFFARNQFKRISFQEMENICFVFASRYLRNEIIIIPFEDRSLFDYLNG